MPITNQQAWENWQKNNTDPYGGACVTVARRVMEILDEESEFDPYKIINRADDETKTGGIRGVLIFLKK